MNDTSAGTFPCKIGNVIPSRHFRSQLLCDNFQQTEANNCKRGGNKSIRVTRNGSLIFHCCSSLLLLSSEQKPPLGSSHVHGPTVLLRCSFLFYLKERHNNKLSKPIKTHEFKQQNVTFNPISFNGSFSTSEKCPE